MYFRLVIETAYSTFTLLSLSVKQIHFATEVMAMVLLPVFVNHFGFKYKKSTVRQILAVLCECRLNLATASHSVTSIFSLG